MGLSSGITSPLSGTDNRVIVLGLARMVGALGNSFLIIVLPLYIASGIVDLGGLLDASIEIGSVSVPVTEPLLIGIVLSLFGFLNSIAQPWTGRLSDRSGTRKAFILAGIALLGTASGLYVFATDYWTIVALRIGQGIGAALTIPPVVALVNEYAESASERGGNFGVFNTFRLIGFGFGPILAGAIVDAGPYALGSLGIPYVLSGFEAAFIAACAGPYLSFVLVYLFVDDTEESAKAAGTNVSIRVFGEDRLFDPVFALGLATIAMGVCIALFATLQNEINVRLAQAPVWFGLQFSAVTITNILFQVPVGRASDRIGRRPFLLFGFVVLVPTTLWQGIVTTPESMLLVRLLQGVAVACVFPPSLALAGDLAGEGESGSTLSILTMGFGLGVAIGPLASGILVTYGFIVPFAVGAALAVFALVTVITQVDETLHSASSSATMADAGD